MVVERRTGISGLGNRVGTVHCGVIYDILLCVWRELCGSLCVYSTLCVCITDYHILLAVGHHVFLNSALLLINDGTLVEIYCVPKATSFHISGSSMTILLVTRSTSYEARS